MRILIILGLILLASVTIASPIHDEDVDEDRYYGISNRDGYERRGDFFNAWNEALLAWKNGRPEDQHEEGTDSSNKKNGHSDSSSGECKNNYN